MPRRREVPKREILPDPKFGNVELSKFMNVIMEGGKKAVAERIIYGALDFIEKKNPGKDPLEAFTIAINEWEWVEEHPMKKISKLPEPRGRVRFLDDKERERLLDACQNIRGADNLYLLVVLALSTGARHGELINLRWRDVDLTRKVIVLHDTKNKERRVLPLAHHALELIKAHHEARDVATDLLFPAPRKPNEPWASRSAWQAAVTKAGLEDFRFHDLRHSAASYLAMNGASLAEIAEVLGHKTLAMVKRYAHLSEAHTAGVVERMNQKIFR